MKTVNEGLKYLLTKYNIPNHGTVGQDKLTVNIGDLAIPLFPWRQERRFIELKNLADEKVLKGISVFRIHYFGDADLAEVLYEKLDLCCWILGTQINEVFAVSAPNAMNITATLNSGAVCNIELSSGRQSGEAVDKHEIIAAQGVACDRVVDSQVPQHSIYVMGGEETQKYTDTDFELFEFSGREAAIIRSAFEALKNPANADTAKNTHEKLAWLVKCCEKSAELGVKVTTQNEVIL